VNATTEKPKSERQIRLAKIDEIKAWFDKVRENPTRDKAQEGILRALNILQARQTSDEQSSHHTSHKNSQGYNKLDAEFAGSLLDGHTQYGRLTPRQISAAAKMLRKYSGQLI
jgi:hypothetical protein